MAAEMIEKRRKPAEGDDYRSEWTGEGSAQAENPHVHRLVWTWDPTGRGKLERDQVGGVGIVPCRGPAPQVRSLALLLGSRGILKGGGHSPD